jgi:hypothetical protein
MAIWGVLGILTYGDFGVKEVDGLVGCFEKGGFWGWGKGLV